MRRTLVCLILSALLIWAQPNQITPVLTQPEVEALEASVAKDPTNHASQTLLANNYAFFILGITRLRQYDQVDGYDKSKADSEFTAHVRKVLNDTRLATLAGESGHALWNSSNQVSVYRTLHGDSANTNLLDNPDATFGASLIDRAVELEPGVQKWRSYRSSVLQLRGYARRSKADPIAVYQTMKSDLAAVTGINRSAMLIAVAQQAVRASQLDEAMSFAQEALVDAKSNPKNWNTGNEIFFGNMILGQVALRKGDPNAAAHYLLASGATTGSPQLNSFGPSMALAKELLDANAGRDQVVEFLHLCATFWKMDRGRLKEWTVLVQNGLTPDFGISLR